MKGTHTIVLKMKEKLEVTIMKGEFMYVLEKGIGYIHIVIDGDLTHIIEISNIDYIYEKEYL